MQAVVARNFRLVSIESLNSWADRVAVKELISTGMIEENGHQVSDLGAAAFRQFQSVKP